MRSEPNRSEERRIVPGRKDTASSDIGQVDRSFSTILVPEPDSKVRERLTSTGFGIIDLPRLHQHESELWRVASMPTVVCREISGITCEMSRASGRHDRTDRRSAVSSGQGVAPGTEVLVSTPCHIKPYVRYSLIRLADNVHPTTCEARRLLAARYSRRWKACDFSRGCDWLR